MGLDPATIAMLISILRPILMKCFEDRTQGELVAIVQHPTFAQRRFFLSKTPIRERRKLKAHWKFGKNRRLSRQTARVIVRGALRKAA